MSSKRLVLTTFGSLGDLHPYMALAIEWQKRGHTAVIATSEAYRANVESQGVGFAPVRPELADSAARADVVRKIMDMKNGPEYLIRRFMVPQVRASFDDLNKACEGADGIIGHPLTFAVPLVAHIRKIPWAYVALAPTVILSVYDPPHLAPALWVSAFRRFGPKFYALLFALVRWKLSGWFGEVRALSKDLGIYPVQRDPMGPDQYSRHLNLALFSSVLAAPQADWPDHTKITGFAFYDQPLGIPGLSAELDSFLNAGEPPIVFTLGSAAVMNAGTFYAESAAAAQLIGRRAVLLIGRDAGNTIADALPESIHVAEYASFSELFPRCAAVVHQGGVGTTAQALRAGKPMLVMPYAFDQPDNGARVTRLGVGRTISRERYTAVTAAKELGLLLGDSYTRRAETIGRLVRLENGAVQACNSIESNMFPPIST